MPAVSRDSSRSSRTVAGGVQRLATTGRALDRGDRQVDGGGGGQQAGEEAVRAVRGGRGGAVRDQAGARALAALGHAVVAQHLIGQRDRVPADRRAPPPGNARAAAGSRAAAPRCRPAGRSARPAAGRARRRRRASGRAGRRGPAGRSGPLRRLIGTVMTEPMMPDWRPCSSMFSGARRGASVLGPAAGCTGCGWMTPAAPRPAGSLLARRAGRASIMSA